MVTLSQPKYSNKISQGRHQTANVGSLRKSTKYGGHRKGKWMSMARLWCGTMQEKTIYCHTITYDVTLQQIQQKYW